jgi:hypothetical protein
VSDSLENAKLVLTQNREVLYGIFGQVSTSDLFPPRDILNEFLIRGHDPCDQDGRMKNWRPFKITENEYDEILKWWLKDYPNSVVDDLGANCWDDWAYEMLER